MSPTTGRARHDITGQIADLLASPEQVSLGRPGWWAQSLAAGAPGVALLHIARARAGTGPWQRAHDWLAWATAAPLDGGRDCHLHHGAPAVALPLHAAGPGRYDRALQVLDRHVATTVRRRLDHAHRRIDRAELPALAEFDAIRGLAGLGAHLLEREPDGAPIRAVLTYLVRLTEPIDRDTVRLPGWWTPLAPSGQPSPRFPGGHANNGVAHGIGGPLALLAKAALRGVAVAGQTQALTRILAWLDRWQQGPSSGPRWPYWITYDDLHTGSVPDTAPQRPSWCYGTVGLARAQQLAARALGDTARQARAEVAITAALSDPDQLATITDPSLCHGYAGLLHLTAHAAQDALTPGLRAHLPRLHDATLAAVAPSTGDEIGLLEGLAGVGLALHDPAPSGAGNGASAPTRWDAWFLGT